MNYIRLQKYLIIDKKKLLWNSRICNLHKARSMDFRFLQNMQFSNIFLFQTNIWIQKQVLVSGKNHIKTTACKVTISDSFIILPPCHSIYVRTVHLLLQPILRYSEMVTQMITFNHQRVIRRESKTDSYSKGPTLFGLRCILCCNFWTNYDLVLFSTSKWPSDLQFCER